jgi:hypothetical protein
MAARYDTRRAGGAAGLGETSSDATIRKIIANNHSADHAQSRARLKFLACRLHELGAKPLFHFLDEVERGEPLRAHLEVYVRLPVAFIKANSGDQFASAVHIVDGDGR